MDQTEFDPALSAKMIAALPQAKPFLFVDRIVSRTYREDVVAEVTFPEGHPVFDGHLPDFPLVPGVIVTEALAQSCGLVLVPEAMLDGDQEPPKGFGVLAEVRRMRFKRAVLPGERMAMRCTLGRVFGTAAIFAVEATVEGELAASGEIIVGGMRHGDGEPHR